jgi:HlyD family secretion protein
MRRRLVVLLLIVAAGSAGVYAYLNRRPGALVLTGIVTTNDVVVSPQVAGQIRQLLVAEGDAVKKDQLLAVINPEELQADTAYYSHNVAGLSSQVRESEAALRFQERQTADQINQAESTLASIDAQVGAATAELEQARVTFTRTQDLSRAGVASAQDLDAARAAVGAAEGKVDALKKQAEAQRASIAMARSKRRAGRRPAQPGAGERASAGRGGRAADQSRRAASLRRAPRADRWHRRRARVRGWARWSIRASRCSR